MLLAFFTFAQGISWRLDPGDTRHFPISETNGWSFVNPILYDQLSPSDLNRHNLEVLPDGKRFITSNQVVLSTENAEHIRSFRSI